MGRARCPPQRRPPEGDVVAFIHAARLTTKGLKPWLMLGRECDAPVVRRHAWAVASLHSAAIERGSRTFLGDPSTDHPAPSAMLTVMWPYF